MNQKGFTLIELIVIIVILGILAVTAIPKYVDMKTDAEIAAANGVYGAAQGAATMNFAGNLLGKNLTEVTTAATLVLAMEEIPEGWTHTGGTSDDLVDSSGTYTITVSNDETATAKAVLTKDF